MNKKEIADRIFDRAEVNQKPSSLFDTTNRIAELVFSSSFLISTDFFIIFAPVL